MTSSINGKSASQTVHRSMALGGTAHSIDPTGVRVDYEYYDDGLTYQVIIAEGTSDEATTTYTYDGDHLELTGTDPVGTVTSRTYDLLGRLATVTVPGTTTTDLLTTIYSYDANASTVAAYHPDDTPGTLVDNDTSVTKRDDLGRTISTTNENGEEIQYAYHLETTWMTVMTDARNKVTGWSYDDLGRLLTKTYAGGVQKDQYTYDSLSRMVTHTRPSFKRLLSSMTRGIASPPSPGVDLDSIILGRTAASLTMTAVGL